MWNFGMVDMKVGYAFALSYDPIMFNLTKNGQIHFIYRQLHFTDLKFEEVDRILCFVIFYVPEAKLLKAIWQETKTDDKT